MAEIAEVERCPVAECDQTWDKAPFARHRVAMKAHVRKEHGWDEAQVLAHWPKPKAAATDRKRKTSTRAAEPKPEAPNIPHLTGEMVAAKVAKAQSTALAIQQQVNPMLVAGAIQFLRMDPVVVGSTLQRQDGTTLRPVDVIMFSPSEALTLALAGEFGGDMTWALRVIEPYIPTIASIAGAAVMAIHGFAILRLRSDLAKVQPAPPPEPASSNGTAPDMEPLAA